MTDDEMDIVVRTVWGEARNQTPRGMIAVVHVIRNRVSRPGWWGQGWIGVCRAPRQFSCWNDDDPNLPKMLALQPDDASYQMVKMRVIEALQLPDHTHGATHYHAKTIPTPVWARGIEPCAEIGAHLFYNNVRGSPVLRTRDDLPPIAQTGTVKGAATVGGATAAGMGIVQAAEALAPYASVAHVIAQAAPLVVLGLASAALVYVFVWRKRRRETEGV